MANFTKITAESRGAANHGWLKSYHSFSFANYYHPNRMHFGALRVLNDDEVAPGMGFGAHPHSNMEIVSIPLEGALVHKDSMGNTQVIRAGDIQIMSAGTGVTHSEYNHSKESSVKFLQIWVIPNTPQVTPRYDQITLDPSNRRNQWETIIAPKSSSALLWMHQDAWFTLGNFDVQHVNYNLHKKQNGVYIFVIKGNCLVGGHELKSRDAVTVEECDAISIEILTTDTELLLMEVPLTF